MLPIGDLARGVRFRLRVHPADEVGDVATAARAAKAAQFLSNVDDVGRATRVARISVAKFAVAEAVAGIATEWLKVAEKQVRFEISGDEADKPGTADWLTAAAGTVAAGVSIGITVRGASNANARAAAGAVDGTGATASSRAVAGAADELDDGIAAGSRNTAQRSEFARALDDPDDALDGQSLRNLFRAADETGATPTARKLADAATPDAADVGPSEFKKVLGAAGSDAFDTLKGVALDRFVDFSFTAFSAIAFGGDDVPLYGEARQDRRRHRGTAEAARVSQHLARSRDESSGN